MKLTHTAVKLHISHCESVLHPTQLSNNTTNSSWQIYTTRHDTIVKSLTWTRKLSIHLNLAHVAETKTKKRQCPFNSVQVKICEVSSDGIRVTMKDRICERDDIKVWIERSRE